MKSVQQTDPRKGTRRSKKLLFTFPITTGHVQHCATCRGEYMKSSEREQSVT